jgi:hypothetical protein
VTTREPELRERQRGRRETEVARDNVAGEMPKLRGRREVEVARGNVAGKTPELREATWQGPKLLGQRAIASERIKNPIYALLGGYGESGTNNCICIGGTAAT